MKDVKFKEYLELQGYSSSIYYEVICKLLTDYNGQEFTKELIQKIFLKKKQEQASETVNVYLKAMKVYLKYLGKEIEMPKYIIPIQKLPDSIALEYLETEIMPVVESIRKNPLKDKAILYFMFYTGIRVPSELMSMKRSDIDLQNRTAKIYMQKVRMERIIVFPQRLVSLLSTLFSIEPEEDNAFNITEDTVKTLCITLKPHFPDIHIRPRLFRHSFATHLFRKGADISIVSRLLGHKNLQSTLKYLNTNDTLLKEMYDRYIK